MSKKKKKKNTCRGRMKGDCLPAFCLRLSLSLLCLFLFSLFLYITLSSSICPFFSKYLSQSQWKLTKKVRWIVNVLGIRGTDGSRPAGRSISGHERRRRVTLADKRKRGRPRRWGNRSDDVTAVHNFVCIKWDLSIKAIKGAGHGKYMWNRKRKKENGS